MSLERSFDKGILRMRLEDTFSLWQRFPNSKQIINEMNKVIGEASGEFMTVKVRKEALRTPGKFTRSTVIPDYGRIEGSAAVFELPPKSKLRKGEQKVNIRLGTIGDEIFFMMENKIENTFAFLKPEDLISIDIG